MKRKNFIQRALTLWGTIVSLPIVYGISKYLVPEMAAEGPVEIVAGRRGDLAPGEVKMVRSGSRAFFLTESASGELRAFSARCSHLGCIVQRVEELDRFRCNCHGSQFDADGVNLTGPALTPLQPFRVEVRGEDVVVTAH